jgi:signal transduction histidine kinase
MHPQIEGATDEARSLRRCMNDLISLCALPAMWSGAGPEQIARTLVDALVEMLQLDFVHLRLNHTEDSEAVEMVRSAPKMALANPSQDTGAAALRRVLGDDPGRWPPHLRGRLAGIDLSIVTMRLGVQRPIGVLIAASERPDFAEDTEMLLLNVAANQAVIALQGARLLGEQTRLARTLNHRVAQRTSELAQVNDELKAEIAERRRTEEELRRSEAFLVEAQRLSSTGSFSWHLDTDEITFSDELFRIFEFERHLPVTFGEIGTRVHPEDVPLLAEKIALARAGIDDQNHDYDLRLQMPDRKVKYLRTVARAIQHQGGRVEYLGTIQDVTERRLSDDTLEKVRSELARVTRTMSLGVLTASIAHEVNQPLSGIITNANTCLRMLAATPPNLDGALETARRTIRDGNRASDVIARLRALFRKKEVVTEAIDLNEATREVIALSSQDLQRRGISLQTDLDDNLPAVSGDRVQLQQVILNLVLNASDALRAVDDRPRQIFVQTRCDDDGAARLSVRDSGVGVGTESLNKLFDAFYTTKADGMGIGLSVSRSIIESHHGRLWCEPNSGPGAMFAFSLPGLRNEARALQKAEG